MNMKKMRGIYKGDKSNNTKTKDISRSIFRTKFEQCDLSIKNLPSLEKH